jgi:hypothetical protein
MNRLDTQEMAPSANGAGLPAGRLEFKFLVDAAMCAAVLPEVATRLAPDPHADDDASYFLSTLYFDTPWMDVYWERARGLTPRHKLRLRLYGDPAAPSAAFVEIKTRLKRRVLKRRLLLDVEKGLALCAGREPTDELSAAGRSVADDVLSLVTLREVGPACLIQYRRRAFVGPDHLRVTFDSDLTYRADHPADFAAGAAGNPLLGPEAVVLEIKVADAVPPWLAMLVARHGGVLRRFSKYCQAVEVAGLLDPALARDGVPAATAKSGPRP